MISSTIHSRYEGSYHCKKKKIITRVGNAFLFCNVATFMASMIHQRKHFIVSKCLVEINLLNTSFRLEISFMYDRRPNLILCQLKILFFSSTGEEFLKYTILLVQLCFVLSIFIKYRRTYDL